MDLDILNLLAGDVGGREVDFLTRLGANGGD